MNDQLKVCLDDIEARIDEAIERRNQDEWQAFAQRRWPHNTFISTPRPPNPLDVQWPHINDAQNDFDLMMLWEFAGVAGVLNGSGSRLNVRCNYGTGIMPSLFGAEMFIMPRETNTLPTARPMGRDAMARLIDAGVPSVTGGLGAKVFECGRRFKEVLAQYPKIGRWVEVYHPDIQGPMDIAEMLWGADIFVAFYEEPDMVRALLDLLTRTYEAFMREWFKLFPPREVSAHWAMAHKGAIMLRNDSLMNISPEMYVEFVRPFDQQLLDALGGGAIHACGRCDHYIEAMSETRGLYAFNFSQPHLNDVEKIYRHTVDKGIAVLGLAPTAVPKDRPLHGLVHTW